MWFGDRLPLNLSRIHQIFSLFVCVNDGSCVCSLSLSLLTLPHILPIIVTRLCESVQYQIQIRFHRKVCPQIRSQTEMLGKRDSSMHQMIRVIICRGKDPPACVIKRSWRAEGAEGAAENYKATVRMARFCRHPKVRPKGKYTTGGPARCILAYVYNLEHLLKRASSDYPSRLERNGLCNSPFLLLPWP